MNNGIPIAARVLAGVWLSTSAGWPVHAHNGPPVQKEAAVDTRASGTFDVKLGPQVMEDGSEGALGRMSTDKQFHGDLEGTSKGQMLTASGSVKDSAGYVAIERVTGTLHGRSGSFTLQHSGTMTRGAPQLSITVVPDSGTGQLAGLAGKMTIRIVDGKHFYDFEYTKE
jgi:flagellar basal body rod protein FlgG